MTLLKKLAFCQQANTLEYKLMPKHIVKKHSRLELKHYILFLIVILIFTGLYLYNNPHLESIRKQISESYDIKELLSLNDALIKQNQELDDRISKLNRLINVDNETLLKLQNEIKSLQEKIFKLKKELTFYQGIITASSYSRGLNIQGLHIEPTRDNNSFKYKLVLTNIGKSDSITEVTIDMSLEGNDQSGHRVISSDEIGFGLKVDSKIKVRNFERVEGSFSIPNGFEPLRVLVDLEQHDRSKMRLHRVFEWAVILNRE